jgi:hypothetical protein
MNTDIRAPKIGTLHRFLLTQNHDFLENGATQNYDFLENDAKDLVDFSVIYGL